MCSSGWRSPRRASRQRAAWWPRGCNSSNCAGGFGPVWAGRVIEAIDGAVPVGVVGYGPEAVDQVHAIFS
ncbi:DUF6506 family protein [Streptomyces sp. Isolate_219]|uniref:DUF6506 family protein n=1 Tax=Streptomyces sp. Isolate_219 TaxID=2950110 RepID=UPI003967A1EC